MGPVQDFSSAAPSGTGRRTGPAELPLIDSLRPRVRHRPLKAWRHFRRLVKNKEDTSEVFRIFEALPWKGMPRAARQFLGSERGKAVVVGEPSLVNLLDDHATLRSTHEGSLAQAYCDFMEREGLTAQGLVDEFERFMADRPQYDDQFSLYLDRLRDTHDLLHVLTGYGRDALGEQCVLAFTYSQQPALAHLLIAYAGAWEIAKRTPAAPIFRAVREAQRLGKACPRVAELPVRELLPLPLEQVRAMLNITPPLYYRQCHRAWRDGGIDPYAVLRPQPA